MEYIDLLEPEFSQGELGDIAGVSQALANNWVRRGFLQPRASEKRHLRGRRLFAFVDVYQARLLALFASSGASLEEATELAERAVALSLGAAPAGRLVGRDEVASLEALWIPIPLRRGAELQRVHLASGGGLYFVDEREGATGAASSSTQGLGPLEGQHDAVLILTGKHYGAVWDGAVDALARMGAL